MTHWRCAALAGPWPSACVLFLAALLLGAPALHAEDGKIKGLRGDAILLLKSFWNTTGYLVVCPKYVGENPPYLDAAEAWKQRHNPYLARVNEVIDGTGGLTQDAKSQIAQEAFDDAQLKLQLRGDSGLYCFNNLAGELNAGVFDFENQEETASALARLMQGSGS